MKKNTKLAYFLRGLGMGIVFTTVVVSFGVNSKETEKVVKEELTDEEIIEKAKEIGMVEGVNMKLDSILDETENEEPSTEVENDENEQEEQQQEEQTDAPEEPAESESEEEEVAEKEEATYKSFTVKSGENAISVARRLKEAGLIDDANAFRKYLDNNGYSRILIAGNHQILVGGSYSAIAEELSTNR